MLERHHDFYRHRFDFDVVGSRHKLKSPDGFAGDGFADFETGAPAAFERDHVAAGAGREKADSALGLFDNPRGLARIVGGYRVKPIVEPAAADGMTGEIDERADDLAVCVIDSENPGLRIDWAEGQLGLLRRQCEIHSGLTVLVSLDSPGGDDFRWKSEGHLHRAFDCFRSPIVDNLREPSSRGAESDVLHILVCEEDRVRHLLDESLHVGCVDLVVLSFRAELHSGKDPGAEMSVS